MKNKYTLILIPPDHRPVRQLQLTLKGKKFLVATSIIALGVIGTLIIHDVFQYKFIQEHQAAYARVEELELRLKLKDEEIDHLNMQAEKINQNLETISMFEDKIATILKLKNQDTLSRSRSLDEPTRTYAPLSSGESFKVQTTDITADAVSSHVNILQNYYDEALKYEYKLNHTPSILPAEGEIVSPFGYRKNPFGGWSKEFHSGIDIAVNYGTPVLATADGEITFSGWDGAYGRKVEINHGYGIVTFYGHNSRLVVKTGDKVKKGEVIAYSGSSGRSTGAHVHFGAYSNGKIVDPLIFVNPIKEQ